MTHDNIKAKETLEHKGTIKIDKDNWEKQEIAVQSEGFNLEELKKSGGKPGCLRTYTWTDYFDAKPEDVIEHIMKTVMDDAKKTGWKVDESRHIQAVLDPNYKPQDPHALAYWFVMVPLEPHGTRTDIALGGKNYKRGTIFDKK